MKLSQGQLSIFWRAFAKACDAMAIPPAGRNDYRHRLLAEETGHTSLTQIDRAGEFDSVMLRLATDAGDWESVAKFSCAGENRVAAMIAEAVRQVMELQSIFKYEHDAPKAGLVVTDPEEYIRGVCVHARIPIRDDGGQFWLDIPHGDLVRIFQMMDTHRRRLLSRFGWKGCMRFDVRDTWIMSENGLSRREKRAGSEIAIRIVLGFKHEQKTNNKSQGVCGINVDHTGVSSRCID